MIVNLLNILRHGLFCLLVGSVLVDFALVCFFLSVATFLISVLGHILDPIMILKIGALAWVAILIGCIIASVGMLMCLAVPDKSARMKVGLSIFFQILGLIFQFLPIPFAGMIFRILGFLYYTSFIKAVAASIECNRVDDIVFLIRTVAGFNTLLIVTLFLYPSVGAPLLALAWLVDAVLYSYMLWTLVAALGVYIEDVKAGRIDPSAKDEKKDLFSRVASSGPVKGPPPEEPTGAPPAAANMYKVTKNLPPLFVAVKEGDRNKVGIEMNKGGNLQEKIKNDLGVLHVAAVYGVSDVTDALLRAGARVDDVCSGGLTPLFLAVQCGHQNLVGLLLSRRANLQHSNDEGMTPLHWACCAPHERLVGASRVKMVQFLLQKGADLNAQDANGRTPRALAEENGLVKLVDAIDRSQGIVRAPIEEDLSAIQINETSVQEDTSFKIEGSELSKRLDEGEMPLLLANTKIGDTEKVQTQLKMRTDPNLKSDSGFTALHVSAICGVLEITDLLLKSGARVDETAPGGLTALYFAIQQNNTYMVGLLLNRRANLHHQDDYGRTPLHWACAVPSPKLEGQMRIKLVQMLLEKKADATVQDRNGDTPATLAAKVGRNDVVEFIERFTRPAPVAAAADDDDE